MGYAEGTKVPAEKTRLEIERVLYKHGSTGFAFATRGGHARIEFEHAGRRVRFDLPLPDPDDERRQYVVRGAAGRVKRTPDQVSSAWDRETRQAWRALLVCITAKFAAIAAGIVTFEEEFLAHTVVPGEDRTVGELMHEPLAIGYREGAMPPLLAARGGAR